MPILSVDKGAKSSTIYAIVSKGAMIYCGEAQPGETTVTGGEFLSGKDVIEVRKKLTMAKILIVEEMFKDSQRFRVKITTEADKPEEGHER